MSIVLNCDWCGKVCLDSSDPETYRDYDLPTKVNHWVMNCSEAEPNRCVDCEEAWLSMQTELKLAVNNFRINKIIELKSYYLESIKQPSITAYPTGKDKDSTGNV